QAAGGDRIRSGRLAQARQCDRARPQGTRSRRRGRASVMPTHSRQRDLSPAVSMPRWTPREMELLAVTLRLLREYGYDRLSVDAVATQAKASIVLMPSTPFAYPQVISRTFASLRVLQLYVSAGHCHFWGGLDYLQPHHANRSPAHG